jgi:DNA-binding response OmpR family regulator
VGADAFLLKPVQLDEVEATLRQLLGAPAPRT